MITQMEIVERVDWDARDSKSTSDIRSFDLGWFAHWLGKAYNSALSDEQVLRLVQDYHMDSKGWRDIAYSFAIGRSGRVFELRGWGIAGGHTSGKEDGKWRNFNSMAFVFLIGEGETATPEMLAAAAQLMAEGETRGYSAKLVRPHNEVVATTCPGFQLTSWAQAYDHEEITSMDRTTAENIVEEAYINILGRPSDPDGFAYWTDRLVDGLPACEMRWAFMYVRLDAMNAVIVATQEALDTRNDLGLSTGAVAAQVLDQFYADLAALRGA